MDQAPRVYLSATTARADEMRRYSEELQSEGFSVVSDWPWNAGTKDWRTAAHDDYDALCRANVFVAFTEGPNAAHYGRGGRHAEFGIALARMVHVILVGAPEHAFHQFSSVVVFDDWPAAREHLLARAAANRDHM